MKEMLKQVEKTAGVLLVGGALAIISSAGCSSTKQPPPPLLGDRGVLPAPYFQPGEEPPEEPAGFEDIEMAPAPDMGEIETPDIETGLVVPPPVESPTLTYTVRKGDSLWKIARKYGVSFKELAAYNDMEVDDTLVVGKELVIPPGGKLTEDGGQTEMTVESAAATGTPRRTVERQPIPSDRKYTVKAGDNLWVIARRFGVKVSALKRVNDLDSDMIHVGDVLVLPESAEAGGGDEARRLPDETVDAGQEPTVETTHVEPSTGGADAGGELGGYDPQQLLEHTVLPGDTIEEIADMYGTSVQAIKRANPGIESDEDLVDNMSIKVPFE